MADPLEAVLIIVALGTLFACYCSMNTLESENTSSDTVSVREAAVIMGTSVRAVRMLHTRGRLPGERVIVGARLELRFQRAHIVGFRRLKRGWPRGRARKIPEPDAEIISHPA